MNTQDTQHKKKIRNSTTGYSIVEMLVYIAILSTIAVVTVNVVISLAGSYSSLRASRNINSAAVASLERIVREARLLENVDLANSTLTTHPGRLTLMRGATTTEFYLDGSVLKVRENGVPAGSLTSQNAVVTNLIFRHVTSAATEAVKIEMTLQSAVGNITKTENFYDFVILRGSY